MGWLGNLDSFFGRRQRGLRRIAATCLLLLGVHTAGDRLDDLLFSAIDRLDLLLDNAAWGLGEAAAGAGLLSSERAQALAEAFGAAVDLAEKDALALWLALLAEIACLALLLDFAFGPRRPSKAGPRGGRLDQLRRSASEMAARLKAPDAERLLIPPALLLLSVFGLGVAALAVESGAAQLMGGWAPTRPFAPEVAAWLGLASGLLLLGRLVPALVEGAFYRAAERGDEAADLKGPGLRKSLRRLRRGWPRAVFTLTIALLAAVAHGGPLAGLLLRAAGGR